MSDQRTRDALRATVCPLHPTCRAHDGLVERLLACFSIVPLADRPAAVHQDATVVPSVRTEMRPPILPGMLPYEVRIEANGHEACDWTGCDCRECRALRAADGRCLECGADRPLVDDRCASCTASGLGA